MNGKLIALGAACLLGLITVFSSFYVVGPNEVVVLTKWGEVVNSNVPSGLHWKVPFAYTANHQITAIQEIAPDKPANTYTNDNQEVDVRFNVFYRIPADKASFVLINVPDYSVRLTAMATDRLKSALGTINIQQLAEKRTEVRANLLATLKKDATSLGIDVTDLQLVDFQYDPKFREAVANAAVQKANVESMEYQRQQAEKTAETAKITALGLANGVREKARGDADALLLNKQAEAQGIKLTGEATAQAILAQTTALKASPEFVAYTQAKQWNGQLPAWMTPGAPLPFMQTMPPSK